MYRLRVEPTCYVGGASAVLEYSGDGKDWDRVDTPIAMPAETLTEATVLDPERGTQCMISIANAGGVATARVKLIGQEHDPHA
jgi:hypothetical protein